MSNGGLIPQQNLKAPRTYYPIQMQGVNTLLYQTKVKPDFKINMETFEIEYADDISERSIEDSEKT